MIELILLILGLIGLVLGAELVIKAALNIAEHFKISHFFLGLTLLAIGTDLPELVFHTTAAVHRAMGMDNGGLVMGNALGTCFWQIGFTLGLMGLFRVLMLKRREWFRECCFLLGSVVLLWLVSFNGEVTRFEGVILIIVYGFYFLTLFREERLHEKVAKAPAIHPFWDSVSLIAGFALLIYCSNLALKNAVSLADIWGIAQSLMGIAIVGIGTGLPELALSVVAMRKGHMRISVGNLIGSNIFDMLFVLGAGATIAGFSFAGNLARFDIPFLFALSFIVIIFFRSDMKINKVEAALLLLIFLGYIGLKVLGF